MSHGRRAVSTYPRTSSSCGSDRSHLALLMTTSFHPLQLCVAWAASMLESWVCACEKEKAI